MTDKDSTIQVDLSDTKAEIMAGTGPGIPDDSLAPGEEALPEPPSEEEVERIAQLIGAPEAEKDTLPLDGE